MLLSAYHPFNCSYALWHQLKGRKYSHWFMLLLLKFILPKGRSQISLHFADSCFGALKDALNINHKHHGRGPLLPSTNTGYGIGCPEIQFTTLVSIFYTANLLQHLTKHSKDYHTLTQRNTWSITVQTMKTCAIKTLQLTHHTYWKSRTLKIKTTLSQTVNEELR